MGGEGNGPLGYLKSMKEGVVGLPIPALWINQKATLSCYWCFPSFQSPCSISSPDTINPNPPQAAKFHLQILSDNSHKACLSHLCSVSFAQNQISFIARDYLTAIKMPNITYKPTNHCHFGMAGSRFLSQPHFCGFPVLRSANVIKLQYYTWDPKTYLHVQISEHLTKREFGCWALH